jgi:microcystin-dependent protein
MNVKNIFFYILLLMILYICYYKKELFIDSSIPNCDNDKQNSNTIVGSVGYLYAEDSLFANYNNITISDTTYTNIFNSPNMKGIIVAWYDDINNIPNGWAYCDGSTYKDLDGNNVITPDLRSRTILGASNPSNINGLSQQNLTPKFVNDISGVEKVTLSVDEAPAHSHFTVIGSTTQNWANGTKLNSLPGAALLDFDGEGCRSGPTNAVGGGKPHNNIPPYMALAYIMKIH